MASLQEGIALINSFVWLSCHGYICSFPGTPPPPLSNQVSFSSSGRVQTCTWALKLVGVPVHIPSTGVKELLHVSSHLQLNSGRVPLIASQWEA